MARRFLPGSGLRRDDNVLTYLSLATFKAPGFFAILRVNRCIRDSSPAAPAPGRRWAWRRALLAPASSLQPCYRRIDPTDVRVRLSSSVAPGASNESLFAHDHRQHAARARRAVDRGQVSRVR